jgi:hypothetical protein
MINRHEMQQFRSDPEMVTILSEVADARAALVPEESVLESKPSFGDSRTEETPDASTISLMFEPPFPIIIPQLGDGTKILTTKEKP